MANAAASAAEDVEDEAHRCAGVLPDHPARDPGGERNTPAGDQDAHHLRDCSGWIGREDHGEVRQHGIETVVEQG